MLPGSVQPHHVPFSPAESKSLITTALPQGSFQAPQVPQSFKSQEHKGPEHWTTKHVENPLLKSSLEINYPQISGFFVTKNIL